MSDSLPPSSIVVDDRDLKSGDLVAYARRTISPKRRPTVPDAIVLDVHGNWVSIQFTAGVLKGTKTRAVRSNLIFFSESGGSMLLSAKSEDLTAAFALELSSLERRAFTLLFEGKSYKEIAKAEHRSLSSIKNALLRVRKKMRQQERLRAQS